MNVNYTLLAEKKYNITSQFGEDGIIEFLLSLMNEDIKKTCLEVGAGDGITNSNVHNLWSKNGWSALLIDSDPKRFDKLEEITRDANNVIILKDYIDYKGNNTIQAISERLGISLANGLIVIDIDSIDCHVFSEISTVNPAICIVEYNNHIPPWVDYQDTKSQVFLRCSLKALERIGNAQGYSLVGATITNAIFVRADLAEKYRINSAKAETLYPYAEQHSNRSIWVSYIASQIVTSYPVFMWKPNHVDYLYYHIRGLFRALVLKREPYILPNDETRLAIRSAGLWV